MRIAHFIQRYPPARGGSEAYFARLGHFLARRGHEVTVFTTTALDLPFWSRRGRHLAAGTASADGVVVRRCRLWQVPGQRYLLKALSLAPWPALQAWTLTSNPVSWDMLRQAGSDPGPFDVVHATAFPYAWPILCARRLARRLEVPFALTPFLHLGNLQDPDDPVRRVFTQPALMQLARSADVLFVQTEGERQAFWERGFASEQLIRQGMGVDPAECTGGDRDGVRARWQVGPGEVVVGHLGNNSPEKGTTDLLEAARLAWKQGASFRVVLAGPQMPAFLRYWQAFPCSERVTLLGELTDAQKRDFLAGIDLFALPSRVDSFGLVLLEAWANGVPCVAYRAGGVPWVIHHESDGVLVPCGDVPALAEALTRLARDEELRSRLGEAGRARALREHRWDDKLGLVEQVYRRLCREQEASASSEQGASAP